MVTLEDVVAVVWSPQTSSTIGNTKTEASQFGIYHALVEARIPFELVYEQLLDEKNLDRFKLLASATPVEGAATINQDATVSVAELTPGKQLTYPLGSKRHAWLHVIDGNVTVNGKTLHTGDAVAVDKEEKLDVFAQGSGNSEILLFDLA